MHNTPEQNAAFRAAFDATNARYRAAVKADQEAAAKAQQTKPAPIMQTNTPAQNFALNQWLSDYPEDLDYAEILEQMNNEEFAYTHPTINPWYIVENFTLSQVADFIEDTRTAFERATA
jgi:hypothetical protein